MDPLIITVAPNGARKTKADHPALPIRPAEIAVTARNAMKEGAAMLHLHVRDEKEAHSLDAARYGEAIACVRDAVGHDMIIQMTTEAVGIYTPEQQMASVLAVLDHAKGEQPDAVSLAVKELIPEGGEVKAASFLDDLDRANILCQYIVYSADELKRFRALVACGVIPKHSRSVLFVLGRYSQEGSKVSDLDPFLSQSVTDLCWMVCAFGAKEGAIMRTAIARGGHCRVGFENNLYLKEGVQAPDNAALVAGVARMTRTLHRPVADAQGARALMGEREPSL